MIKKISICLFSIGLLVSLGTAALAVDEPCVGTGCPTTNSNTRGAAVITLDNPLSTDDPRELIGLIIRVLLGIVGTLALAFFIYGGLTWMTSAGNSSQVEAGKNTLIWATLGLVAIFSSYTVLSFILTNIPKS